MLKGYVPISEPVHNHEYPLLWDLLFDRHPKGQYYRGQFESLTQPFPPRTLLEKMFEDQPTCLILDEFQTWYMGLPDKDPKTGLFLKQYAFNFVQILSEIAKDRPEILIFVISVLNNQNDAFQQVHRQGPVIIDFRGPSAKQDRQKLLLHRLFENRRNIPETDIVSASVAYATERFRLLQTSKSESEKERVQQETFACWPFSPELLELLEDQILLSSAAQETRDLIRILAQVFRSRGDFVPLITPADFFVDGDSGLNIDAELNNPNFRIKKSVDEILKWYAEVDKNAANRMAARTAAQLVEHWRTRKDRPQAVQRTLFELLEEHD
jgi:hypothetical protein